MNYEKVISELERQAADFLAGFEDADEMADEKAAHRAMVCAVHALKKLVSENAMLRNVLTNAERELVRLFTVLPLNGHMPSPSVMQECQAAQMPPNAQGDQHGR